jgi:hypothetical protein
MQTFPNKSFVDEEKKDKGKSQSKKNLGHLKSSKSFVNYSKPSTFFSELTSSNSFYTKKTIVDKEKEATNKAVTKEKKNVDEKKKEKLSIEKTTYKLPYIKENEIPGELVTFFTSIIHDMENKEKKGFWETKTFEPHQTLTRIVPNLTMKKQIMNSRYEVFTITWTFTGWQGLSRKNTSVLCDKIINFINSKNNDLYNYDPSCSPILSLNYTYTQKQEGITIRFTREKNNLDLFCKNRALY